MGNPVPPAGLCPAFAKPFELSSDNLGEIAAALGLPALPPPIVRTLEAAIAVYKMQSSLPSVTVGENLAALNAALEDADAFQRSLRPFIDKTHSGVGMATVHAMNPAACEANAALRKFRVAAQIRKDELQQHKRLGAEHGPLGGLCAWLRFFFEIVQEVRGAEPRQKMLRTFALAVLQAADFPCDNYREHPSRMEKLFNPEIPDGPQTQSFIAQLRQEIEPYLSHRS